MSNNYILFSKKIFNGYNFLYDHAIVVENGKIVDIDFKNIILERYKNLPIHDMKNHVIAPSFIDLHINGCGGVLLNDDISINTLEIMHKTNLKFGCTSFLPTLITTTPEEIKEAVNLVAKLYKEQQYKKILGIHIEGPYISSVKKGIHNAKFIKPIDLAMVDFLIEKAIEVPIKITMAPETNDLSLIHKLAQNGVIVSLGHSNATHAQAQQAIEHGISLGTHLFNAMSGFEGRNPGVVGALLNSDIPCGIIVDGYHVNYNSIALVKKIKQEKLYIVTDAVTPMGTDMSSFTFANQEIMVEHGKCVNKDGTLAGSHIDMMSSVKNCVQHVGISLAESLRMASLYPARVMSLQNDLGLISKGFIANLVVFDENFKMMNVIENGQIIN